MNSSDQTSGLAEGIGFLADDRYLLHDPGIRHPESPQRLVAIQQMLHDFGAAKRWQLLQPRKATV